MKRVLQILILLFIFYYGIQIMFTVFDKGYEITYNKTIDNKEFTIKEVYVANQKKERDNYFLEVTVDDNVFYFKTYANFKKMKNIIKDIKYIDTENYDCILPIYLNNTIVTDAICKNDFITTYYYNIKGTDSKIDEFINNIDNYNINNWEHTNTENSTFNNVIVYKDNFDKDLFLSITSYKGLYNINKVYSKNIINVDVFNNDIYNQKISTQIDNYYLVANYNDNYTFTQFYLLDLMSKEYDTFTTNHKISFNSYFQGVVDDSAYLIDIDNKKQYEIDIKTKKVIEIGNEELGIKYYNDGNWEKKTIVDAINNEIKFNYQLIDTKTFEKNYARIDQIGSDKTGYYYLYEQTSSGYNVYKSYIEKPNETILLFTTHNIDRIKYIDDTIIYVDKNYIKSYNDVYGVKMLIQYDELEFNKNISIFGYYNN